MSRELKLPELGENIDSGTVLNVLVSPGDRVVKDQNVLEMETEKAVAEVPSDIEGVVQEIHVDVGDEVEVGQLLITFEAEAEEAAGKEPVEEAEEAEAPEPAEESAEELAEAPEEAEAEAEAPAAEAQAPPQETAEAEGPAAEAGAAGRAARPGAPLPAAPSVRRRARELDVDLTEVRGSGPAGRISQEDVESYAREGKEARRAPVRRLPDFSRWGEVRSEPMSKVRRLTADGMSESWAQVPHAVQFGKADVSQVEALRDRYQTAAEQAGGHLSLTVILVKTLAGALRAFPQFNASVDEENDAVVYKDYVHIGVAVASDRGLVVPVVRNVDRKSIVQLSVELGEMTEKAREGKVSVEDMQGGSMTLTNGGALGGDLFIPIVNWPEAAILGVARTVAEPVFEHGAFRPRRVMPLSLSYDHRLIDGADAIRFVRWIVEALEDPLKLLCEG